MRLASFNARGRSSYGAVVGDGIVDLRLRLPPRYPTLVDLLRGDGLAEARAMIVDVRPDFPLAEAELLPPLLAPEKILCVGVNYANRHKDFGDAEPPRHPSIFFRHPGSLVGHGQKLHRPVVSEQLDFEGEIALVIGRGGRRIARERALEHVVGYMLCNEGTVRDWLRHGKFNVTQGKNFDASGSIGPWLTTADEIDPAKPMHLTVKVNGVTRQDDTTASMVFSFADLIVYMTTFMTLRPGDIIVTGTPVKIGAKEGAPEWLKPGDVVELHVPELGSLRNEVVAEK
ncbi:MAG: fumarylacetoacetate hydrolase family protein [Proteobacteria bacterium]|nr:fumarylacetoacetate hydrolase family protein [Pseudomonadota bacterium]